MKNFKILIIITVILHASKIFSQNCINSAYILTLNDGITSISVNNVNSELWFKFVAPDTGIIANISFPQGVSIPVTNVALYKKKSDTLYNVIENDTATYIMYYNNSSTDTSYIRISFPTPYDNRIFNFNVFLVPPNYGIGARQTSINGSFNQQFSSSYDTTYNLITLCYNDQPIDLQCIVPYGMLSSNPPYTFRFKSDGNYISNYIDLTQNSNFTYPFITTTLAVGTHYIQAEVYYPTPYSGQIYSIIGELNNQVGTKFLVHVLESPNPVISGPVSICTNLQVAYTTQANMQNYVWTITGGTIISGNGTKTVTVMWNTIGLQTISVTYTNGSCQASSSAYHVMVGPPPVPVITGSNNNCNAYQTPALSNIYFVSNPQPSYSYLWTVTSGVIVGGNNGTSVEVKWNQNIANNNPATITISITDENECVNSSFLNIYNCCFKEGSGDVNYYDQTLTQQPSIGSFFINGTVVFDCNVNLSNISVAMGPYAKIIVTPNHHLFIDQGSVIQTGCNFMWDGIYVEHPDALIEVTGNSTIKDAINGLVSDNGGIINIDDAKLKDNYYNVKISNTLQYPPTLPYLPYTGSIKKTEFIGNNNLPFPPFNGHKTYDGIHCINVYNPFTIGDETSNNMLNKFSNMRFGIYAYDSDIEVYNCSFKNIFNGNLQAHATLKYYPEGAIYAIHNGKKPINTSNKIIVGGTGLKRNYFENCNTGIYSFQYLNKLENNDFKDCFNGISLVNITSGAEIKENMVYGSSASTVTPGKGISVRNAHPDINGTDCLIEENHNTNKQIGISLVNVKSSTLNISRVLNNIILNNAPVFPTQNNVATGAYIPAASSNVQTSIMAEGCDGIQIKDNTVNRNYPVIASEKEYIRGIRISESKNAYVFHNFMVHQGSGIYTNGLLTNTRFDCNILDHDWHGFNFGLASLISDQGSPNIFNPHNAFVGNYIIGQEKLFSNSSYMINGTYCNGIWVPTAKWYYFDNSGLQFNVNPENTSPHIDYIINNNAIHYCESGGGDLPLPDPSGPIETWQDREEAMGEIVRDERLYGYMEEYYRARDREYVYEILREDPSLLYMGAPDDNLYLQFYSEMLNSEAEQVLQLREATYEEDLAVALSKLQQIVSEDQININRLAVDAVYLNTWRQGKYSFNIEQENILQQIAYLTPYSGGDAVYTARVMLNIDPDDFGLDFVKPPYTQSQTIRGVTAKVYPNPANKQITIQFSEVVVEDAHIRIYNSIGSLVYNDYITKSNFEKNIDVRELKSGLYFYNIEINGEKVTSGKITILNK